MSIVENGGKEGGGTGRGSGEGRGVGAWERGERGLNE